MGKKETDIVDFIFDNLGPLMNNVKDVGKYLKEAWNIFPDVIHSILVSFMGIISKIYMRIRSYMALQLTRDMNHMDMDKEIWNYMHSKHEEGEFLDSLKKIKHKNRSSKSKDYLRLIYYYVNKNERDKYLALSITQQNNPEFIKIRKSIIDNMMGVDKNASESDLDSIFIKSSQPKNRGKSKYKSREKDRRLRSKTDTDVRIVSVIEAHDSIRQETERRTRLE